MFDRAFRENLLSEAARQPAYSGASIAAVLAVAMAFEDDETVLMIADGYCNDQHLDAEDQGMLVQLAAEIRIGEPQGTA